jgi:hypothetical protein
LSGFSTQPAVAFDDGDNQPNEVGLSNMRIVDSYLPEHTHDVLPAGAGTVSEHHNVEGLFASRVHTKGEQRWA